MNELSDFKSSVISNQDAFFKKVKQVEIQASNDKNKI